MLSLGEARARVVGLAEAGEAVEVALSEAIGLVLAEPAVGDVDLPPFDRAAADGYAVRSVDARPGAVLRVVGLDGPRDGGGVELGPGEAMRVASGGPMPVGADALARTEATRPESGLGAPSRIELVRGVEPGRDVVRRGYYLGAGAWLAPAGAVVRPALAALLASQGCLHPLCHRRARVAILAVGDDLIAPGDAPNLSCERSAANLAVAVPCLRWGATALDLGVAVDAEVDAALARALTAPVALILGEPDGVIPRALARAGVEPVFSGVAIHPGKRISYGVTRGPAGRVEQHVFHLPAHPVAALVGVALVVAPLVARLHGLAEAPGLGSMAPAILEGPHRATDDRLWAVPVTLRVDASGTRRVTPLPHRGGADLPGFAAADALALLPARSGPWLGGEVVEVADLGPA